MSVDDLEVVYNTPTDVVISSLPSGVTPGSYGSEDHLVNFTVDTYGRVTNASQIPIVPPVEVTISSSNLTVAGGPAYTVNLASSGVTPGTYGSSTQIPSVTVNTNGIVTAVTNNTIPTFSSGYYSPTWTWVSGGSAAPTALTGNYIQVGEVVNVFLRVNGITTTSTSSPTATITLPVLPPTNFTDVGEGTGCTTLIPNSVNARCYFSPTVGAKTMDVVFDNATTFTSGGIRGSFSYKLD